MRKSVKNLVQDILEMPIEPTPEMLRRMHLPLYKLLRGLSPRREDIIRKTYAVGMPQHTLFEIGMGYGWVSDERIREEKERALRELRVYSPYLESIKKIVGIGTETNFYSIDRQISALAVINGIGPSLANRIIRHFGTIKNLADEYYEHGRGHIRRRFAEGYIMDRRCKKIIKLLEFSRHPSKGMPEMGDMSSADLKRSARELRLMLRPDASLEVHSGFKRGAL